MDKEKFQERIKKIKEVDEFIKTLDSSIRETAFKLLEDYITGRKRKETHIEGEGSTVFDTGGVVIPDESTKENFFSQFDHEKPSDNALLIAAYHYSQFGTAVLTIKETKEIADSVGITIPNRVDVTFKGAKKNQKSLFQTVGKGKFKPTVHGEKYFKETYGVTKGTKTKVENEDKQ